MSATTPDQIADAFIAVLTPGGIPVGGIAAIVQWTPDAPYEGLASTPIVQIRCVQNVHGRKFAAGGMTLGKVDQGYMEVVYRDATWEQQKIADPTITLTQIEKAAVAARNAIVATLDANNTLGGEVTIASEHVEELYRPDGFYTIWQGAEWIGWSMRVDYEGDLPT